MKKLSQVKFNKGKGQVKFEKGTRERRVTDYRILDSEVKEKRELQNLSWTQKLVCKWFKIIPLKLYFYTIKLTLNNTNGIRINSVIKTQDGNEFLVVRRGANKIEVKSLNAMVVHSVGVYLLLIAQMAEENGTKN